MLIIAFHKVTFETLSGSVIDEVTLTGAPEAVEEQNIAHNSLLDNTNDKLFLTSQSHVFKYWSETEGGSEFDVKTQPILKDMKLYAVWEAKVFTVSYDTQIEGFNIPSEQVKYGKQAQNPVNNGVSMVQDGYRFKYISLDKNGDTGVYNYTNPVVSDLALYCVYKILIQLPSVSHYVVMGVKRGSNLYTWGNGIIGTGDNDLHLTPTLVPKSSYDNKTIKDFGFAYNGGYLLTTDNDLYVWGKNVRYALGLGDNVDRYVPTLVPKSSYDNKTIKKVVQLINSVYLLMTNGDIYTFGANFITGFVPGEDVETPTLIPRALYNNQTVKDIYGAGKTLFLLTTSNLWVLGQNNDYNLGLDYSSYGTFVDWITMMPTHLYGNNEIKDILPGMYNSTIYTTNNKIYQFGFNPHRVLFDIPLSDDTSSKIQEVTNPIYPYGHEIAVNNGYQALYYWDSKLYVFGWAARGQAGDGNIYSNVHYKEVSFFNNKNVTGVMTNNIACFALVDENRLYSWGGNKYNDDDDESVKYYTLGHIQGNKNETLPIEIEF